MQIINKNSSIYTDMAVENVDENTILVNKKKDKDITISKFHIDRNSSKLINKKIGNYITIDFLKNSIDIKKIFREEIINILKLNKINDNDSCLVVGLGNIDLTSDSLGPKTTSHIVPYMYNRTRKVYVFNPNVMANTGLESSDVIKNIIKDTDINFIIVIDSLKSESIGRLCSSIQITDTGIYPGSGLNNNRKELSKEIFNIPVIAIGIPTVISNITIVNDTFNMINKYYTYLVKYKRKKDLLNVKFKYNHEIQEDKNLNKIILGELGILNNEERKDFLENVLYYNSYDLIVTNKSIDEDISYLSTIIGQTLNNIL